MIYFIGLMPAQPKRGNPHLSDYYTYVFMLLKHVSFIYSESSKVLKSIIKQSYPVHDYLFGKKNYFPVCFSEYQLS
jgi:hypothetical protein